MKKSVALAFVLIGLMLAAVSCTPIIHVSLDSVAGNNSTSQSSFLVAVILLAFACLCVVIGVLIFSRQWPPVDAGAIDTAPPRGRAALLVLSSLTIFLGLPMAHLLVPLWASYRFREIDPPLAREARRLLNFQITWTLFAVVALVLCVVLVGLFLLALLLLMQLAVSLRAAWAAWHSQPTTYPLSVAFVT